MGRVLRMKKLLVIFLVVVMGTVGIPIAPTVPVALAASCAVTGPGTYAVNVCFDTLTNGQTASGNTPVAMSVTPNSGTPPLVQRMTLSLDGQYLLIDYQSPYAFTLHTARWVDGSHTLSVIVTMRDAWVSPTSTDVSLTFANGVTTPPVNT